MIGRAPSDRSAGVLQPFALNQVEAACERFRADGVIVVQTGLRSETIAQIADSFSARPGRRDFALDAATLDVLRSDGVLGKLATQLLGHPARPVRVLKFDKSASANWGVPWHQDRVIAVANMAEVDEYGPWSLKAGVHHVEPPEQFLRDMVALRLHLDDCDLDNGPLEVALGTFSMGRIPSAAISATATQSDRAVCVAKAGDVVAMRGLTLHASGPARRVAHRRVLHVDYAMQSLPAPLEFALMPLATGSNSFQ